jgi:outer membrane protein OmpA-like peptidoglycan-associated protein
MPGGFGGSDLYISSKNEQNQWSKPQNLGDKINSEGDEMFPFLQESNEILLFSSTGHYGFGGLDVFMCRRSDGKVGAVSNIGLPLNSCKDDYALILNDSLANGYFSSNRNTDNVDHIFAVDVLQKLDVGKKIIGVSKDYTGKYIPFASITLLTEENTRIDSVTSNKLGEYAFLVPSNQTFQLVGKKQNYRDAHRNTTTFGKEVDIYADLVLLDTMQVDSTQFVVGNDLAKVLKKQAPFSGNLKKDIAYFDFDQSTIRPDAVLEFDKICAILNDYPSMMIELTAHTDCSATEAYNQILSEKRAQASLKYIQQKITNPARVTAVAYGETKLTNGCDCHTAAYSKCSDAQNQLNRRTEFILLKDKYTLK